MVLTKRLAKLHVGSITIINAKIKYQMIIRHGGLGLPDITKYTDFTLFVARANKLYRLKKDLVAENVLVINS